MELKSFFTQDLQGNVIDTPTVYLYAPGTTTLATGLQDKDGNPLSNPFSGTTYGQITFAAPDGDYDIRVTGVGRDFSMRVRFRDPVDGAITAAAQAQIATAQAGIATTQANAATTARTAAEAARDSAFVNANVYADVAAGRAAVADGQQFAVASADEIIRYRRDSSTTQTEVARFPAKTFADAVTLFPARAAWATPEPATLSRILSLQLFGADPAKFYFVKYHFWKDVGTRYNLTIQSATDINGTGAVDVAQCVLVSGADTWNTVLEVNLVQVGGSGVTGTALVDFRDQTALNLSIAPTTSAMYQRRRLNQSILQIGTARQADIGAKAASALNIRNRSAQYSAFAGGTAGNDTQTGLRNTGFGYAAADALTTGTDNTAFGSSALSAAADKSYSSAFGSSALSNSTGQSNTAMGYQSGATLSSGDSNTLFGFQSGYGLTSGVSNVAAGHRALFGSAVSYNVAIGASALQSYTGTGATAVGEGAATGSTTATNLTAIGRRSAYSKTTGADCTFIGHQAGYSGAVGEAPNTGDGVTALGAYSFGHNGSGSYNSGFGRASGWYNTSGSRNTFGGYRCGYGNTVGNDNIAFGFYSCHNTSTGSKNIFIGSYADSLVPSSTMAAAAVSGSGLAVGAYSYRVTFVLDGVETGLSEPAANATTTVGNQQVNLSSIPTYTGPRTCSARNIYRTPVGGENLLYLVASINDNTTTTYSDTTPDASLGAQPVQITSSIGIGYEAHPLKSNQMVVGSSSSRIAEVVIGGGVDDTAPVAVTIGSSNASGFNVAGADLRLRAGTSTGSGKPGRVILAAAAPGASSTTHNATVDWVELDGLGFLNIKETSAASVPAPASGSINLFVEGGALKFRNSSGTVLTVSTS